MKTIGIRDLLRGGYKDLTEPVMVMSHNRPIAIWRPTDNIAEGSSVLTGGYFYNPATTFGTATQTWGEDWGHDTSQRKKTSKP